MKFVRAFSIDEMRKMVRD
jgi:hypothetical protein